VIHVRAVSPTDVTEGLVESLSTRPGVLNLIVLVGVAHNPDGDAVEFDVISAEANEVLHHMRMLGVARRGSIMIEDVGTELSDRATEAEARAPRVLRYSPVWEEAESRIRAGGRYPPSWFILLTIAGLIAAVGIFTNSQILIVGAMVVGPEYSAIISVGLGITTKDRMRIRTGAAALFFGFLIAIVVTLAFSVVVRALGHASFRSSQLDGGPRPMSPDCPTSTPSRPAPHDRCARGHGPVVQAHGRPSGLRSLVRRRHASYHGSRADAPGVWPRWGGTLCPGPST
jgi:hypothetical protein